jgi:hypothetical protein
MRPLAPLLPGEKDVLRLHPAWVSAMPHRLWALLYLLAAGLLWAAFHAPWWQRGDAAWWEAWRWLWGTDLAAYLWTATMLAVGGAVAALPGRRMARAWIGCASALAAALATLAVPQADPADALPAAVAGLAVAALAWTEAVRLGTMYHVTSLRLVVRARLPRRTERSFLYADLADVDVKAGPWPDVGTLIPVPRGPSEPRRVRAGDAEGEPPPAREVRLAGVRPLRRVVALVEALARRATMPDAAPAEAEVAQALAALQRR